MSNMSTALVDPVILAAAIAFIGKILAGFWKDRVKSKCVTTAILAEIKRLLRVIQEHSKWWEGLRKSGDTGHPLIPFSYPIYRRQIENLGLLTPALAGKVAPFFGHLEFLNELQVSRERYAAAGKLADFDQVYASGLRTVLERYSHTFDDEIRAWHL